MSKLRIPSATYRLQFSGQFRFEHARALAVYLDQLGVTDLYASPLEASLGGHCRAQVGHQAGSAGPLPYRRERLGRQCAAAPQQSAF